MPKNFQETIKKTVEPALMKELKLDNPNAVPRFEKIVLNVGMSKALKDAKMFERIQNNLAQIAGQHPVVTRAKKSISNFGIREGMGVGLKVTLRGERMYSFIEKLVKVTMPRIRDFKGISPKCFDGNGNYTLAIKEQTVFPEVKSDEVEVNYGLEICMTVSTNDDKSTRMLLEKIGFIFK